MSFANFLTHAINKGARLTEAVANHAAHFDNLLSAVKAGRALDPAALAEARKTYKALIETLPQGERAGVAREFSTQVARATDGDLAKKDAFMKAFQADEVAATVAKAETKVARKTGQAAENAAQTLSNLTPKTSPIEAIETSLIGLRKNLSDAGLLDTSASDKVRAVKAVQEAVKSGSPITPKEFDKLSLTLREESLGAERTRLATQIERAQNSGGAAGADVFDRLETLRARPDYPKGRGQSTGDVVADLKAGRPVPDDQLESLRTAHTTPPAPAASVVNGLSAADVSRYAVTLDPAEALRHFPSAADQVGWLAYYSHQVGPKISSNIRDAANGLSSIARSKDRVDVDKIFTELRNHLRDTSQERLVVDPSQLGRQELVSPRKITDALSSGDHVSEGEINRLRDYFVKYHSQKDGASLSQPSAAPSLMTGNKWALAGQAIDKATQLFTHMGSNAPKRAGRTASSEWETGIPPGLGARAFNSVLDSPKVMGGITAATLGISGYGYLQKGANLDQFGRTQTILGNLFLPEENALQGVAGVNDVVGAMYTRMIRDTNSHKPGRKFHDLTKKITGIDLSTEKLPEDNTKTFSDVPFTMNSAGHVEMFRRLIEKSQAATGSAGPVTTDALAAYKLALSTMIGTEKPTASSDALNEAWAHRASTLMRQNPSLAKAVIKTYYGEDINPDDDRLLINLSTRRGVSSSSEAYFPLMAEFLIKTGKLDKIETAMDPKSLAIFITDRIQAHLVAQAKLNAYEMRFKTHAEGQAQASSSPVDLNEVFNGLTSTDHFGMKGKRGVLQEAYQKALVNGTVDPAKLDSELQQAGLNRDQRETVSAWALQR